jgi:type IX secretion system substrate protein
MLLSETGLLTAVADGEVQVKATANDGSGVEGTMIIDITNQDNTVTEIALANLIEIYPNPTEGKFFVQITNPTEDLTIQILNLYGQVVYNNEIPSGNENVAIDLSNNESGIYIIKLSNNSEYAIKRIVLN